MKIFQRKLKTDERRRNERKFKKKRSDLYSENLTGIEEHADQHSEASPGRPFNTLNALHLLTVQKTCLHKVLLQINYF